MDGDFGPHFALQLAHPVTHLIQPRISASNATHRHPAQRRTRPLLLSSVAHKADAPRVACLSSVLGAKAKAALEK